MRSFVPATVALLALTGSVAAQDADAKAGIRFATTSIGGQKISQDLYADSVLLVDLWGTWCRPCRDAIPHLAELHGRHKQEGLEIVGFAYEKEGSHQEQVDTVRKFAVEHRITWTLAIGNDELKAQVAGFSGYPTLLLFRRGLVLDKMWTGFSPEIGAEIDERVRQALAGGEARPAEGPAPEAEPKEEPPEPEKVPAGRIFRPGEADTGFEFTITDVDGKERKFADAQGKPVLLALTTTWDREAEPVADLLQRLQREFPAAVILAGCIERARDEAERTAAVRAFRDRQALGYPVFVADLQFTRKLHRFAALPTLLVFDGKGALVLREDGMTAGVEERLRKQLQMPAGDKDAGR